MFAGKLIENSVIGKVTQAKALQAVLGSGKLPAGDERESLIQSSGGVWGCCRSASAQNARAVSLPPAHKLSEITVCPSPETLGDLVVAAATAPHRSTQQHVMQSQVPLEGPCASYIVSCSVKELVDIHISMCPALVEGPWDFIELPERRQETVEDAQVINGGPIVTPSWLQGSRQHRLSLIDRRVSSLAAISGCRQTPGKRARSNGRSWICKARLHSKRADARISFSAVPLHRLQIPKGMPGRSIASQASGT